MVRLSRLRWIVVIVATLATSTAAMKHAGSQSGTIAALIQELNRSFPPATEASERTRLTQVALRELDRSRTWDAFLWLSAGQTTLLLSGQLEAQRSALAQAGIELRDFEVALDDQSIRVKLDVRARLENPRVEVGGSLEGIVVPAALSADILLRPVLSRVLLTELRWLDDQPTDLGVALPLVQAALNHMLANVNGRIQTVAIPVAFPPLAPVDPAQLASQGVRIAGRRIELARPALASVVFLVSGSGLRALVDLQLPGEPPLAARSAAPSEPGANEAQFRTVYEELSRRFDAAAQSAFGPTIYDPSVAVRIAVTRHFIASAFNHAAAQVDWTISIIVPPSPQSFDNEVRLLRMPASQSCEQQTDNRECSAHQCSRNHDTRSCRACLLRRPWDGGCIQEGNDPVCESAKAAQNAAYDTAYSACQADAARLRAQCETAKAAQNAIYAAATATCRAGNAIIQGLANFAGRIGRVSGTVTMAAQGAVRVRSLSATPTFDALSLTAVVEATADVSASVTFIPSDLGGHLLCQFPVRDAHVRTRATFGPAQRSLNAQIGQQPGGQLLLVMEEFDVDINARPRPVDALFDQNPALNVTCVGANALARLGSGLRTLRVGNLPSAVTGDFSERIGRQIVPIALPVVELPIPGAAALRLAPALGQAALMLDARSAP